MKSAKVLGWVCLCIAFLLALTAVLGHVLSAPGKTNIYTNANALNAQISARQTASLKTAPSAIKKASAALQAAQTSVSDTGKALKSAKKLTSDYASMQSGDSLFDQALQTALELENYAKQNESNASSDFSALADELRQSVQHKLLESLSKEYDTASKSIITAEGRIQTAISGITDVYKGISLSYDAPEYAKHTKEICHTPEEYIAALTELSDSAQKLEAISQSLVSEAESAQIHASEAASLQKLTFGERIIILIGSSPIGFAFTAFLFLLAGYVLAFRSASFILLWKRYSIFSTFIALVVMIVIQVYALGFRFSGYGEWGLYWLKNMLNVLRSNSSVGMIALGMTFVIITGGIDLAVGSNLAGVATVVMVCLDVSGKGFLTGLGVTGTWNYLIAIAAGLVTGALLGALTGLGITKGRIPPFIFTLGVMNIVRSVAQYFTKSYKPEVPKAFQVIANHEIIGDQMLLPIIYWLALAAIMYVISAHTAFGRHIFAVGSNERASRLSGIDVDRVKLAVYILMGVIVAIAAVTSVARLRGVDVASAGSGYEMNAIAAVVVGGTSMAGGRGSIIGTVFGVLIIGIMNNLLVLVGVDAFLSAAFTGAIIIFAVLIQKKER